ncbi:unnamed protein product [Caenorhabditis nigoni]
MKLQEIPAPTKIGTRRRLRHTWPTCFAPAKREFCDVAKTVLFIVTGKTFPERSTVSTVVDSTMHQSRNREKSSCKMTVRIWLNQLLLPKLQLAVKTKEIGIELDSWQPVNQNRIGMDGPTKKIIKNENFGHPKRQPEDQKILMA